MTPRYGSVVDEPSIRLSTRKNSKSRSDFEFFRVRCFGGWSPREGPWEAWEGLGGLGTGFPQLFEHFAKLLKYEPGGGKPTPLKKIFKVSCSETRFSRYSSKFGQMTSHRSAALSRKASSIQEFGQRANSTTEKHATPAITGKVTCQWACDTYD